MMPSSADHSRRFAIRSALAASADGPRSRKKMRGLSFVALRCDLFGNRARILLVGDHEDQDFCTLVGAWISGCRVNRGRRLVKRISGFQRATWLAVDCEFIRPLDHVAERVVARVAMPGAARPRLPGTKG